MNTTVHGSSMASPGLALLGNNIGASQFAAASPSLPGSGGANQMTPQMFGEFLKKYMPEFAQQQGSDKLGDLLGNLGAGADIASGLARIYLGFQASKQAKAGLNLQREAYYNNLKDNRTSFNKALHDQAYARDAVQGTSNAAEYIKKFKLG